MKYFLSVLIFLGLAAFSTYGQKSINKKPVKELPGKSYPIDGSYLLENQYKEVAAYNKAHPGMYSDMKMEKTTSWGFTVGSTHTWYAADLSSSPATYYQVSSTCRGVGTNCYIFVEDASWTDGKVNQAAVDSVINEFDNKTPANPNKGIYQMDVDAFGNPPDVDNDPKIIILILDVKDGYSGSGGYVAGFFAPINETTMTHSNHCEMYYMDCNPTNLNTNGGLQTALETCAHEFQHMINYNYHQTNPEVTFINEGCSMLAEIYCGYPPSGQSLYAGEPNHYLLDWRGSNSTLVLNDYARAQRFFMYWLDQFGIGIFQHIVQDNQTGIPGLSNALSTDGQSITFTQLFTNWEIANELEDRSVDTKYGYTISGIPQSASRLLYVPSASGTDTVKSLGAEYLKFTGGSNLNITFSPGSSSGLVVKALETGTGGSRVVDVPLNSNFSESGYGSTYNTIIFAVINTSQSSEQTYSYNATQTLQSTSYELKWDNTEPTGYYLWTSSDTVCVTFDALAGGKLDSIRVALRRAGSITGGVWQFTGKSNPSPLGKKLAVPITASISTDAQLLNPNSKYPYNIPYTNWSTVDLRSYNISTDKPFAVGFVIGSDPTTPGVMTTEYASSSSYHSYTYLQTKDKVSAPGWYFITTNSAGDTIAIYLIRAYVSMVTGVQKEIELKPSNFSLSQNYPNPFNPSTNINFELKKSEKVRIFIYNQLGEEITKLVDREYSAGSHTVNFNAANLSSGVYFYKIEAGSFIQTKKMVLLK